MFSEPHQHVHLISAKIYEGDALSTGGRSGIASVKLFSDLTQEVNCSIEVMLTQFLKKMSRDSTLVEVSPGESTKNISIFLPDGQNKMRFSIDCN